MNRLARIGIAVLGYGHIGRKHVSIIKEMDDYELLAVADQLEIADSDSPVPFYRNLDEMLRESTRIELVSIATPNGLHEAHTIQCLRAGKHVVVEKPMALSSDSCDRMVREAEKAGKELFSVLQNRYSPAIQWLKKLLEAGSLGKIFMVQVNCFWNRDGRYYTEGSWHGTRALDGGTLYTQFSHFIDIIYYLFGDIKDIRSKFAHSDHVKSLEIETGGMIIFDFEREGMGNLNFTTAAWNRNMESSMTVLAERGTVKISGQYMNQLDVSAIEDFSEVPEFDNSGLNNHKQFFQHVAEIIKGKTKRDPGSEAGKKVVEIIERIYQSGSELPKQFRHTNSSNV